MSSAEVNAAVIGLLHGIPIGLIGRICLVCMFPFSAADKVINHKEALLQARSSIVPAALAPPMLVAGMAMELGASICIVSGWMAAPAALLLALYCIVTALLFHVFWTRGDFWLQGPSLGRSHFWDFTKNFGLAGGLLLVAAGAGF